MFSDRKKNTPDKVIDAVPYSALSQIYDQVMNHVNYERWARHLIKLARLHGVTPQTVLDLSCGTGRLCQELTARGYDVLACDASLPMLQIAAAREEGILYWCASMDRVAVNRPVHLAISSYDSMNYLHTAEQWRKTLMQTCHNLLPGGLFIFDVSTLRNSLEIFADYVNEENFSEGSYRRKSVFDAKTRIQYNYFEIELTSEPGCLYKEVHSQTIRPLSEIVQYVEESPLALLGHYADFSLRPGSERADRVHFVLQKAPQSTQSQELRAW
jgi:SAM-dependent methyltransferase